MGLSASQTRFLNLTARKSNVEYQGQQINQARTELANQSSALFTQMMNLKAPTAPSVYTFVINPAKQPDIDWSKDDSWPLNKAELDNFMVYYAANQASFMDFDIPEYQAERDDDGNITGYRKKLVDDEGNISWGDVIAPDAMQGTYCYKDTGKDAAGNKKDFYRVCVDESANYIYDIETGMFNRKSEDVKEEDLPKNIKAYNLAISQYNIYSKPTKSAIYDLDANLDSLKDNDSTTNPIVEAYKLSPTMSINQAQYDAAFVQYQQDLEQYNEEISKINAKTDEIHEADKKLEMQLKQLDTEQEAIQTEYEAVKKVIDKNIENTFKSFA